MKKLVVAALAVCMAASFIGCGKKSSMDKDTLVMATNAEFPPYEYYDGDDVIGIDVEIAQAVCDELGKELVVEDMAFDSIITSVASGKADFGLAGITITDTRKESVNFSDTYAHASQVVIVTEDSDITCVDDLTGKTLGVQLGTTGDIYAGDVEGAAVERYNKGFEAVQAMMTGKIDAVIIDQEPAKAFVAENEGIKILEEKFTEEDYAMAIAKDNDELVEAVNEALATLKASGKLDEIVAKYIKAE